jgi:3-dehydroquinate dehydratase-2
MKILVLQGPNLNLLGSREPELYGAATLASISADLDRLAAEIGVTLEHYQSNQEGALVDKIQAGAAEGVDGVLINPGAYTHTSIAIRDAFLATQLPFVEVHLSNLYRREEFRHHSLLADVSVGMVMGLGSVGYSLGLRGLVESLRVGA